MATDAQPAAVVATPIVFACPHCRAENHCAADLAGCVVTCSGCGRNVIVPMIATFIVPETPYEFWPRSLRRFLVTGGFAFGAALLLGLVSLAVAAFIEKQTIGMTMFDVIVVGLIGAAAGLILGGMVGWRVSRE